MRKAIIQKEVTPTFDNYQFHSDFENIKAQLDLCLAPTWKTLNRDHLTHSLLTLRKKFQQVHGKAKEAGVDTRSDKSFPYSTILRLLGIQEKDGSKRVAERLLASLAKDGFLKISKEFRILAIGPRLFSSSRLDKTSALLCDWLNFAGEELERILRFMITPFHKQLINGKGISLTHSMACAVIRKANPSLESKKVETLARKVIPFLTEILFEKKGGSKGVPSTYHLRSEHFEMFKSAWEDSVKEKDISNDPRFALGLGV